MNVTDATMIQAQKDYEKYVMYCAEYKEDKHNVMRPKILSFKEMFGYEIFLNENGGVDRFEGERYTELLYKKGDRVKLPFGETGTVVSGKEYAWMKVYKVRIRKAVFNKTNQKVEFFERQMDYETQNKKTILNKS